MFLDGLPMRVIYAPVCAAVRGTGSLVIIWQGAFAYSDPRAPVR